MIISEPTVGPGWGRLNDGTVLRHRRLPEVLVIFVQCESMSLSEAKSPMNQFLETWYFADFEEFPAGAPEEVGGIHVLAVDLEDEAVGELADRMEVST